MTARLAYVVSRFPKLTETFILREILELQRLGWPLELYSVKHEREAVRQPDVAPLEPTAHFLEAVSTRTLSANARLFSRSPRLYTRLLTNVVWGNRASADFLTKGLATFPGTIELAERMRRSQVSHIHACWATHPALLALLAAEIVGVGFSFTVHAHELFVNPTMLAEKVRRARFVVTVSEFNRRRLCDLVGPAAVTKVEVVHCGIDLGTYHYEPREPRAVATSILAVGSLQEYKGFDCLVRACALIREAAPRQRFTCNIIGAGPLRRSLERLIASFGLQSEIRLLGGHNNHAVRRCMEQSDTMVVPSIVARNGQMDGIPVVLMEAMAVGLPVVASDLSGIPELVRHGETGLLVPPGDPVAIRDAVLECWRAPKAAVERAWRGRQLVEREFDLATNVSRLAGLFERALASGNSRNGCVRSSAGRGV